MQTPRDLSSLGPVDSFGDGGDVPSPSPRRDTIPHRTLSLSRSMGSTRDEILNEMPPLSTDSVKTKGRLNFMELPVELRVKIYELLSNESGEPVILPKATIPRAGQPSYRYPGVSLLTTCKLVNEEMTPVFYGGNTFRINIPISLDQTFFIRNFRWSTLQCMERLKFYGDESRSHVTSNSSFACSGPQLLELVPKVAMLCSPVGPDESTSSSMMNLITTKVLLAELADFQSEMEGLFHTHEA